MERYVELSGRAIRDVRRLGREAQGQIRTVIDALAVGDVPPDVKTLEGHAPWLRLRSGDYRLIYRPLRPEELRQRPSVPSAGFLVARVVHRRDLERAVGTLP